MAIKENSKQLSLGLIKSKAKRHKIDVFTGRTAQEKPKNIDEDKILLDNEESTKKYKTKIKNEPSKVKNNLDINKKPKKVKKVKQEDDYSITESNGEMIKKVIKEKKRKLFQQENDDIEIFESNTAKSNKKLKKEKKNEKSIQVKEGAVDTNNKISKVEEPEEVTMKTLKKQKKRKLSGTDIVDSDATDSEEIPQKKKKKVEQDEEKESEDPEVKARTVFVGNVPLKTTKKDIKKQFRKYGIIDSIRIRGIPAANPKLTKRVAAIKQEFHPERNNFLCYIRYKNKEDAQKAEAENGALFQGHHLRVHCCESKAKPDESKAIFVGNLSFNATEDELWKLFEICGPISHVRIIRDTFTGMGKGFAYVNFKDSDAVQLALEMEDVKLRDRELRISLCNSSVAKKNKKMNKRKEITKPGQPRFKKPFKQHNRRQNDEDTQDDREFLGNKKMGGFSPKGKKVFQGSKFNEKKKKFKKNKGLTEKKKKVDMIAPKIE